MSESIPIPTPARPNKRRGRRQPAKTSTKVRAYRNAQGLGPNIALRVLDLSETGVRILVKEEMQVGQEFQLSFEGPGARPVKVIGNVCWCMQDGPGTFSVGAGFQKSIPYADLMTLSRS